MYQTPSKVIDDMFLSVPQNVKKKKKKIEELLFS